MLRKLAIIQVVCLLCIFQMLVACGGGGGSDDGDQDPGDSSGVSQKDWTYLVYMGADNNLSTAGVIDLNEMEMVGSDENINIVLQAEFSTEFTPFSDFGYTDYSGQTLRFLVQADNNSDRINLKSGDEIGNVNMGHPNTLRDFIQWGTANYPAKHYALVIWDHGAGWKSRSYVKGAVEDATSDSFMSLPDLAKAVRDAGVHLDVINFDACLMAMYEVAYEFKGLVDYMVFSEETEPGSGDPYDTILAALAQNPGMTPSKLAETIVEKYVDFYRESQREDKVTKSAINMAYIEALDQAVVDLSNAITSNFATNAGGIFSALNKSQRYAYPTNYDLFDWCSALRNQFPSGPIRIAAQALIDLLNDSDFVIKNQTFGESVANSHGLAIYAPQVNQISSDEVVNELSDYSRLACNQARSAVWLDAVEALMQGQSSNVVPAGFAFYVEWTGDADVDLYVWEPGGLYAPWSGQTTPNGFMSGDSADTGVNEEYYAANDYVQPGDYDAFVFYYADGPVWSYAPVTFWLFDPAVSDDWQSLGTFNLDNSNPYLGDFTDLSSPNDLNNYSDWWYPGFITRAAKDSRALKLNAGGRTFNIQFKKKKKRPSLENLSR
ncbi:MAG: hypothetical protein C0614_10370 [Desulfuromonas sp.]|nr:MAG: hypothetical protein C0614_10370 [Desulfuromonas sp.]